MTIKPLLFLLSVIIVSSECVLSRSGHQPARQLYRRQTEEVLEQQEGQELVGLKSFLKHFIPAQPEPEELRRVTAQEISRLFPPPQFPVREQTIQDEIEQSDFYIIKAGRPQIFIFEEKENEEDTETLVEEDRDSGRRGDSRRRIDVEEILAESLISESKESVTDIPETEFSTIKLDLTSVAISVDRESGIRKLHNKDLSSTIPRNSEGSQDNTTDEKTDKKSAGEEEEMFGQVLEVNLTVESPTSDYEISEDYDEATGEIPADEKETVDNILNTEILRKEAKPNMETSSFTEIKSTTATITTGTTGTTGTSSRSPIITGRSRITPRDTTTRTNLTIRRQTTIKFLHSKRSTTTSTTINTTRTRTTEASITKSTTTKTKSTTTKTKTTTVRSKTQNTTSTTTSTTITTITTPSTTVRVRGRLPFKRPSRGNRVGFNRGSVEARPDQAGEFSARSRSKTRKTSGPLIEREEASVVAPSSELRPALALISYWVLDQIKSDPRLSCSDLPAVISRLVRENQDILQTEQTDPDLVKSAERISSLLIHLIKKQKDSENRVETEKKEGKDSVHGDDVARRRNRERIRNQKFNKFSSRRNVCGCEHGGECLQDTTRCFCSHGFTGEKCQKRVRKAVMVGGLAGLNIRNDTELVGGLEVRRCSPPDYPLQVMAATGQSLASQLIVCGGAHHDDTGALVSTELCHVWEQSTSSSSSWSSALSLQTPRSWSSSVVRPGPEGGEEMLVIGGVGRDNKTLATIEVVSLSPTPRSHTIPLSLPSGLSAHCSVQLNSSHTLIAGGSTASAMANISSSTWYLTVDSLLPATSMIQARAGHSCTSLVSPIGEVEVVVVGGVTMAGVRQVLDTVEIFNPRTGRWRLGPRLPRPVFGGSMLELSGQPVLFGGRYEDEDTGLHQSSQSYLYQNTWRSGALRLRDPRDLATILPAPPAC